LKELPDNYKTMDGLPVTVVQVEISHKNGCTVHCKRTQVNRRDNMGPSKGCDIIVDNYSCDSNRFFENGALSGKSKPYWSDAFKRVSVSIYCLQENEEEAVKEAKKVAKDCARESLRDTEEMVSQIINHMASGWKSTGG